MSRLIDADNFKNRMYHEAFEKDSDMQKWDSGCWIRYKLFENVLREQPTITPEIQCKDCKHYKYGMCMKICANKSTNGFCDWGERREVTT